MTIQRYGWIGVLILALSASGCGTSKEKTAPCRRPATLSGFAPPERCDSMRSVNTDPTAALRALEALGLN